LFQILSENYCKYIEKSDRIINLRLFGIFGKYEQYQTRFISNAICKTLFNLPITIEQNAYFDYVYVIDFVRILDYFMQNNVSFKQYNVGTGKKISLLEIARIVKNVSGKNLKIKVSKTGLKNEYTCNNSRLKSEIKNLNFTGIEQSIRELYFWYEKIRNKIEKGNLFFDE
ncbi:NAD-dependent epimerase/dehydratase, partial [Patescibacteria group bacterium]|nr:NAD-dependent epimerase/dehydratase [Patescibacteria group bacterium]